MMIAAVVVGFQIMWFPLALRHSFRFSVCVLYLPCGKACIMESEDSFIHCYKTLFLDLALSDCPCLIKPHQTLPCSLTFVLTYNFSKQFSPS